ncbi:hypothetical protein WBP07_21365 (plasmid) [Novosphingobium sp. BL-8A]|uniref:hypothetical protein n=1 Tax=Novosphingobium sp. BL-8A TaxID=3127639 RepID=UPI00375724DF
MLVMTWNMARARSSSVKATAPSSNKSASISARSTSRGALICRAKFLLDATRALNKISITEAKVRTESREQQEERRLTMPQPFFRSSSLRGVDHSDLNRVIKRAIFASWLPTERRSGASRP